uniref:ATP-dependent DNA helicase n=1 Tax=Amphimedon queenslandica TaxID=400682 RepID=A0A1X7SMV1_AMPQE
MCKEFNETMLANLPSPTVKIRATNLIDGTGNIHVRRKKDDDDLEKKVEKKLKELNKDINNTGGLEAKLKLAVGARVMLRCNVNVEKGLVNGALGTVQAISETRITVKFDRITDPCEIEKVKRKFMVMKNVFVYRSQFPLILAFAVTIHKCQGLSLDNAIIDLSENVFSAGMAYVALSRVRTLSGVHLTCFNPKSLMVSSCSIKEINRLRQLYRPDLPQYAIPTDCGSRKRTLTGIIDEPQAKNQKNMPPPKVAHDKRSRPSDSKNNDKANCPKKPPTVITNNNNNDDSDDCVMTGMSTRASNLKYHPPNAATQKAWCNALNLGFVKSYRPKLGSPTTELTVPKGSTDVPGDGNCLFNALSHAITGSYIQQNFIRSAIIRHMPTMENRLRSWLTPYNSVKEYIAGEGMDKNYTWAGDIEMLTMADLLNVYIYSYNEEGNAWVRYSPLTRNADPNSPAIYLTLVNMNHYRVVTSIADKEIANTNNSGDKNACDDDKKKENKKSKKNDN